MWGIPSRKTCFMPSSLTDKISWILSCPCKMTTPLHQLEFSLDTKKVRGQFYFKAKKPADVIPETVGELSTIWPEEWPWSQLTHLKKVQRREVNRALPVLLWILIILLLKLLFCVVNGLLQELWDRSLLKRPIIQFLTTFERLHIRNFQILSLKNGFWFMTVEIKVTGMSLSERAFRMDFTTSSLCL